jgi:4-carboxymuconolactone decarboxylase
LTLLARSLVAAVSIVASLSVSAQSLPIENIQLRGDRFRGLHYREMTEEQRALLYNVVNSARAVTNTTGNGPFNTLLRSPQVGELSQQLGNAIRFSSGLSGHERELATLMAGRAWTSTYEWYAHARYALDEGIDASVVDAIAAHRTPDLKAMPPEDAMVWRVADELLYTRRITDATYKEALAVLGERRLLSTVTIAAYYEYVSMLLNVDRYPLPADAPSAAAAAARALAPLSGAELQEEPRDGWPSARPAITNEDTGRALEALGARVKVELDNTVGADLVVSAVQAEWVRGLDGNLVRGIDPADDVARAFAIELLATRFISDATFAAALDAFGERGVVNLMVLMGYSNILCAQQALAGAACKL